MPQLTVVLPVFNDVEHLPAAIARVLDQKGVHLQLVLVDDGSTDGSSEVVSLAATTDERVTSVLLPLNGGVSAARRRGVEAAEAEWTWFVDSDDDWPSDAALRLLEAATADDPPVDVVVARALLVPATGAPREIPAPRSPRCSGPQAIAQLLQGEITGHLWNKLFRTSLLREVEFPTVRVQSDLALVANALAAAETVASTHHSVYEYRKRAGSVITSRHRRAESLTTLDRVVAAAAARAGIAEDDPALTYFRLRYIALSGLKDALSGAYGDTESKALVEAARAGIGVQGLSMLLRRRDKRVALAALAYAPRALQVRLVSNR